MLKKLLVVLLLTGCSIFVFSQSKPTLGIMPFTGGASGDGETIATMFSNQSEILDAFTVVLRTSAFNDLIIEQNFQLSGYTDSDTIARMGRILNADFVVSGHISPFGKSNLIIATIINVETFEQMAGDYRTYQNIEEIREIIPAISKNLISASRRDTSSLPKLAIRQFTITNTGVNKNHAEILSLILAIEIAKTGKYAILPRTTTMQAALKELEYQRSGYTEEEEVKRLGQAANATYVLSAAVRKLDKMNIFTAHILHVENGSLLIGVTRDYLAIDDGIPLMKELALSLTDQENAVAQVTVRNRSQSREGFFADPARFWSIGLSAGSSFTAPWPIGTIHGTIAPLPYSFLELGLDFGCMSGVSDVTYYSIFPYAHYALFLSFANEYSWYVGAGGGYMITQLTSPWGKDSKNTFVASFTTGFIILNMIDISYTLRTNFKEIENKVSVGCVYRFN